MVPEEWPIAAPPIARTAYPAHFAGRSRLAIVQADFFLDPVLRLNEQERALMTAMLANLIGTIADELRAHLPTVARSPADGHRLLAQLSAAGLLRDPDLIGLLLRRADEERIAGAMRARSPGPAAFLQGFVADADASISAAAMALILGRGSRRDRMGQARLQIEDLPEPVAVALTWIVAAAVWGEIQDAPAASAARQLAASVDALLARRIAQKALLSLSTALVEALDSARRLDDATLSAAAEEGEVCVLAEALARRGEIPGGLAWQHLIDPSKGHLMLLLRIARVERATAARLLGVLGDIIGISDPVAEMARFDGISDTDADAARAMLRLDAHFHETVHALEAIDG